MLPAAARGQFAEFSESVYRYGRLAGMCFAAIQGGPYYGPRLIELVARVRELGVAGVGQSSWGPTLFALRPDEAAAAVFTAQLRADLPEEELKLVITPLNQTGVRIDTT
jgi:predicted sugar kinase